MDSEVEFQNNPALNFGEGAPQNQGPKMIKSKNCELKVVYFPQI